MLKVTTEVPSCLITERSVRQKTCRFTPCIYQSGHLDLVNIDFAEAPTLVIAKLCGGVESRIKVTYSLLNETHGLCLDKKDLMIGQIEACEKMLRHTGDQNDKSAVEQEMRELRMALDLMT